MSDIPDDEFELIARLLIGGGATDEFRSKIVRLLEMDDDDAQSRDTFQARPAHPDPASC
jgi:hypothetical protein